MAYQNVGTPRFYVDWTSYLLNQGIIQSYDPVNITQDGKGLYTHIGMLNPTQQRHWYPTSSGITSASGQANECGIRFETPNGSGLDIERANWSGVLGHNLGDYNGYRLGTGFSFLYSNHIYSAKLNLTNPIINCEVSESLMQPTLSGFSLCEANGSTANTTPDMIKGIYATHRGVENGNDILKFGSFCFGEYYDMPHSPDLNLKMKIEMDGVKTIQSKGGATLSNASYTKPADWGDMGCWQVGEASNLRNGRRVWDLSFSYLSDTDVFPINASTGYENITSDGGYYVDNNNPTTGVVDIDLAQGVFDTNVLSGSDFFSVVWNKTMGGHLPFIFQPDNNNSNPDQFAICRFDMNSLQYEQVANNVYNIKLKIRESW